MAKDDRKRNKPPICFYCGCLISKPVQFDHYPIPADCGGKEVVPCCLSCHDMKDRFLLEDWPSPWMEKVYEEIPTLSREMKLFLSKCMVLFERTSKVISLSKDA